MTPSAWHSSKDARVLLRYAAERVPRQLFVIATVACARTADEYLDDRTRGPTVVSAPAMPARGPCTCDIAHNHPSGDPTPSAQDVALTRQIKQGGELLSLRLMDHLVIGRTGDVRSFSAMGMMK